MNTVACTAEDTGINRLNSSLTATMASDMVNTKMVSSCCGTADIGAPSGLGLNGDCLGAGVNAASFRHTKEECLCFSCTLLPILRGRLPAPKSSLSGLSRGLMPPLRHWGDRVMLGLGHDRKCTLK